MNSSKKSILNSNFTYLAAFVLPFIMMMALYYTRGIFPWGNECYLRSDMYHQYAPFFSELWHKIRNGESLTYSWNIGMGTNFTSLFAYYLASPSNWFVALFPQKYTIEIMNAFIILKIAGSMPSRPSGVFCTAPRRLWLMSLMASRWNISEMTQWPLVM